MTSLNNRVIADVTINPSFEQSESFRFNNEAHRLKRMGDLQGAERLHLRAIALKERGYGMNHYTTALSWNGLGELYIQMGRLDEAEDYLKKAVRVRNETAATQPAHAYDAAASRDNLARVYEMRGDLKQAREIRISKGQKNIACSNFKCPLGTLSRKELAQCGGCKATFYCGRLCQSQDWKTHKKYCKKEEQTPVPANA